VEDGVGGTLGAAGHVAGDEQVAVGEVGNLVDGIDASAGDAGIGVEARAAAQLPRARPTSPRLECPLAEKA